MNDKKNNNVYQNTNEHTVIYNKSEILKNSEQRSIKKNNKSEKKRLKEKSKRNKHIFRNVWIVMIVLISFIFIKYILIGINDMLAISRVNTGEKVTVDIPAGSSMTNISNILYSSGVIKNKSFFTLYAVITKSSKKLHQGKYEIKFGMDYEAIITYLQGQSNRTDLINLTFPEGKTILETAKILSDNGICDYNEFLDLCNSSEFDSEYSFISNINNTSSRYYKLEGYLFPDTYTLYQGEDPKIIITRFLSNYENKIMSSNSLKNRKTKTNIENLAKEKNISLNDLLILSSLIQAEAANTEDMYYISSIFHNRLSTLETDGYNKFGEYSLNKLGSDVTVWYPYKNKNNVPNNKLNEFPGKYNTYEIVGLPAGPVCNPGLAAIDAALNPKDTDYYYFCHNADGKSYYAKTNSEHQQNLVKAGLK